MRHDRHCFGRLEQEDQRLKKHYGRWMDIIRSVELESCILTKLTKPFIPVNLVGPLFWVPACRGNIHFLCVIRRHFLACEDSWWVRHVSGGHFISRNTGPSGGSQMSGGGIIILCVIRRHFLACSRGPVVGLSTYSPLQMHVGR